MGILNRQFHKYLLYLWPLPTVFMVGQIVMWANGNAANLGISVSVSLLDMVVFVLLFAGAAWWAFRPIMTYLVSREHPEKHRRVIESVVANFPWRTLKAYSIAGWLYALYLIVVISSVALMGDYLFTWRMFVALTLNFSFGAAVLAPALAVSSSIVFTTRLRAKLALQGLFVSELGTMKMERYLISSQYRPWLVFMVTGFLPTMILGLFVFLSQAGEVAEEHFILAQAMVLLSMSISAGSILVWFLSHTLKHVTLSLQAGLHHLAEGHFTGRVPVLLDDEFGELARGLNTAMHGLQEREDLKDSLAIAAEIQQGLLPKQAPVIPRYKLEGFQQTCFSVGGDYFDYIELEDGRIWLMVADVSGKGYPAALTMANLQAMLRGLATVDWPIEVAGNYLNDALCESLSAGRFVTLFMGKLQPETHSLVWMNAGHVPPLLASGDEIRPLEASGPPLGLMKGMKYEVVRTELNPGDTLLAYTDGVTETSGRFGNERFGEKRLRKWLEAHRGDPIDRYPALLLDELNRYGRDEQDDDLTLLCVRRE
ncbi:Serine phosphatase RsbU, regulator of sigma subunit [Mariprofundus ferrinatatus]|uniref:Serine phosphatase RsbU, regulator of sigma subunit n=1 Tax=Mariprofundus ferrinatatus TaxID=1921087 RepID=A0A2K8L7B1_9PROT|nr:PP2C family protein-serine/threonine phosphatase [Mariprofundus ferrinatatus]ATX81741.1 Serine phosphatase RsbU, regulator of sigma subunit [Mariprofundus ferrinatatus]